VRYQNATWYAATREELAAIFANPAGKDEARPMGHSLGERFGPERTPLVFPDLPLDSVLPYFKRWPLLPVSNRALRGALEGVVSLDDVLRRYQQR